MLGQAGLGVADVVQERAGGADSIVVQPHFQPEAAQILAGEITGEQGKTAVGRKLPAVQAGNGGVFRQPESVGVIVRHQHFGRLQPRQLVGQPRRRGGFDLKLAALQRHPGQRDAVFVFFVAEHRGGAVGFLVFQQRRIGERARGNDAHHFARHRPFARAHFAHLLADGDAAPHLHQPRQILLDRMVRHARHLHRLAVYLAAGGQGDVQQFRRFDGIVDKQFVKVAHAVKQQFVLMLRFDVEILLHHRGNGGFGAHLRLAVGKMADYSKQRQQPLRRKQPEQKAA